MAFLNYSKKELDAKIVYYGPALCGKTTNVKFIHDNIKKDQRGKLISIATQTDRTLFFDFLPIELGDIRGFKTRFHIYTVPGQVFYNATRRAVLTGVDGIVFVADSQRNMLNQNIESMNNLEENLATYGKKLENIPHVMQYNKRDLSDILSVDELNKKLNKYEVEYFESIAINGKGVLETLTAICTSVLKSLKEQPNIESVATAEKEDVEKLHEIKEEEEIEEVREEEEIEEIRKIPSEEASNIVDFGSLKGEELEDIAEGESQFSEEGALEEIREEDLEVISDESQMDIEEIAEVEEIEEIESKEEEIKEEPPEEAVVKEKITKEIKVTRAGEPESITQTLIKIPLSLKLPDIDREYSFTLSISIENLELKIKTDEKGKEYVEKEIYEENLAEESNTMCEEKENNIEDSSIKSSKTSELTEEYKYKDSNNVDMEGDVEDITDDT